MGMDLDVKKTSIEEDIPSDSSQSLKQALKAIDGKRLPFPRNWSSTELDEITFPDDLTLLTLDQLGSVMSTWTAIMAYVEFEVAKADVERLGKENKYEFEKRKHHIVLSMSPDTSSMSEELRKSYLITDEDLHVLQIKAEHAKAQFVLMRALLKSYSKYYTALSRELSRRGISPDKAPMSQDDFVDLSDGKEKGKSLFRMQQDADEVNDYEDS